MDNNFEYLKENLETIIPYLNDKHCHIWERKFPAILGYSKENLTKSLQKGEINMDRFCLYIHIPFCISKCYFCNFYIPADIKKVNSEKYVECLILELENFLKLNKSKNKKIISIFVGGGTPTLLNPKDFEKLMKYIYRSFSIDKDIEIIVESTPQSMSKEWADVLSRCKVTEVILGIQTFNEKKLKKVNRSGQTNKKVYNAVKYLKSKKNIDISFDLIYGLTIEDNKESFLYENLEHIKKLQPNRVIVFSHQNYINIPEAIQNYSYENLEEIRNKIDSCIIKKSKKFKLYHNQYFYLRYVMLENVLGIGLGGSSDFWINGISVKKFNKNNINKDVLKYKKDIETNNIAYKYIHLSPEDSFKKYIAWSLYTPYGLNKQIIKNKFPKIQKEIHNILNNLDVAISISGNNISLKKDFNRLIPFKVINETVNYFIFVFTYIYSDIDRERLIIFFKKLDRY